MFLVALVKGLHGYGKNDSYYIQKIPLDSVMLRLIQVSENSVKLSEDVPLEHSGFLLDFPGIR